VTSTRFVTILTNLVSKCIKFTEEGKVTVDIEALEVSNDLSCGFGKNFLYLIREFGIPEDKRDITIPVVCSS